jgi:hypothetical protein
VAGKRKTVQAAVPGVGGIWCPRDVPVLLRRGVWAVTPTIDWRGDYAPGSWSVTHVPTGIRVNRVGLSLREARWLCRQLGELLPDFGARARFGVRPRRQTSDRWRLCRAICGRE